MRYSRLIVAGAFCGTLFCPAAFSAPPAPKKAPIVKPPVKPVKPVKVVPPPAAAPKKVEAVPVVPPDPFPLQEPRTFFPEFMLKSRPVPRDPFDSDAEYAAKAVTPWDSSQIIYFEVEPDRAETFTYKAETETLTLPAGHSYRRKHLEAISSLSMEQWGNNFVPLGILYSVTKEGEYEGVNGLGVTRTVKQWRHNGCIVWVQNRLALPPELLYNGGIGFYLKPSFTIPRDLARTLTKEDESSRQIPLQVIAGFKFKQYKDSGYFSDSTKPTVDKPEEDTYHYTWIKGDLVRIVARDRNTKKVYADFDTSNPATLPFPSSFHFGGTKWEDTKIFTLKRPATVRWSLKPTEGDSAKLSVRLYDAKTQEVASILVGVTSQGASTTSIDKPGTYYMSIEVTGDYTLDIEEEKPSGTKQ